MNYLHNSDKLKSISSLNLKKQAVATELPVDL